MKVHAATMSNKLVRIGPNMKAVKCMWH